MTLLEVWVD